MSATTGTQGNRSGMSMSAAQEITSREMAKLHLEITISSRGAAAALQYTLPRSAERLRDKMRKHALQARGAIVVSGRVYTPRPITIGGHVVPCGAFAPAGQPLTPHNVLRAIR